jgi:hypothetical protein
MTDSDSPFTIVVDQADGFRFILVDLEILAEASVSVRLDDLIIAQQLGDEEAAPAEAPLQGKQHGFALHVALFLGYHGEDEENDVAGRVERVDAFLFKVDGDGGIMLLKGTDPGDTIHEISGETADRFCDDHVKASLLRVLHHQLKGRPMLGIGSREAIIDKGSIVGPIGSLLDQLLVVALLFFDGRNLLQVIR